MGSSVYPGILAQYAGGVWVLHFFMGEHVLQSVVPLWRGRGGNDQRITGPSAKASSMPGRLQHRRTSEGSRGLRTGGRRSRFQSRKRARH
jgi:hypothetical protein